MSISPSDTSTPVSSAAPSLPSAGSTFTDPDFGTTIVRVTNAQSSGWGNILINAGGAPCRFWKRDGTAFIIKRQGVFDVPGYSNIYGLWSFNPNTHATAFVRDLITSPAISMSVAAFDWSGDAGTGNRLYSAISDNSDSNRKIVYIDTSTPQPQTVVTVKDYLSVLQVVNGVTSGSSSTSFVGTQTDWEAVDDIYIGMTLTMLGPNTTGTASITAYNHTTKTFTLGAGLSGTPTAVDTWHLNYVGYSGLIAVAPTGKHFVVCVSEGVTGRGTGQQDTARTLIHYNSNTDTLRTHHLTAAELSGVSGIAGGGVHAMDISDDGLTVVFTVSGGTGGVVNTWTPLTDTVTSTAPAASTHRAVGSNRWWHYDLNGRNAIYNTFAAPATENTFFAWPTYASTNVYGFDYYYGAAQGNNGLYQISIFDQTIVSGLVLHSGNIYKYPGFHSQFGDAIATAANNFRVRVCGELLTQINDGAGSGAAAISGMAAGNWACDITNDVLYLQGKYNEDFTTNHSETTGVTIGTVTSSTVFTLSGLAGFVPKVGQILLVTSNTFGEECATRITAWNPGTSTVTVSPALPSTPSGGESVVLKQWYVQAYAERPMLNEIVRLYDDDLVGKLHVARVCHMRNHIWTTLTGGSGGFDEGPNIQVSYDGRFLLTTSNWNGSLTRDAFIIDVGVVSPVRATITRTTASGRPASGNRPAATNRPVATNRYS